MFYDSFRDIVLGKTIPEVQCYTLKLDMLAFYACNKMYITAAAAVSNDIKTVYFSKTDFECNLLNENCANLLSIYTLQSLK